MLPLDGRDGGGSGGSGRVSVPPYPPKHKHRDRARMHISTRAFFKADNFVTPVPSETRHVVHWDEGYNCSHFGHRTVKPNVRVLQFWDKIKCRACYDRQAVINAVLQRVYSSGVVIRNAIARTSNVPSEAI